MHYAYNPDFEILYAEVDDESVCSLNTTRVSTADEDMAALLDLLKDEYGVRDIDESGTFLDIIPVPDDVSAT